MQSDDEPLRERASADNRDGGAGDRGRSAHARPAVNQRRCTGTQQRGYGLNGDAQKRARIAGAINHLRDNFTRPVRVEELAQAAGMSASSFHQHFKALTSMSPLQYQKQLRLLEARRLMLTDGANVSSAAYQVGYESASQFSREYARKFGAAPKRETSELKGARA